MKIISSNCQGLAKPKAVRALGHLLSQSKPDILFICEVKTLFSTLISNALSSHSLANHGFLLPSGTTGRLIIAWTNSINLNIIPLNYSFIHTSISHDPNVSDWLCTFVYTPSKPTLKAAFWNSINNLNVNSETPCLLMGDFHSITSQAEKER